MSSARNRRLASSAGESGVSGIKCVSPGKPPADVPDVRIARGKALLDDRPAGRLGVLLERPPGREPLLPRHGREMPILEEPAETGKGRGIGELTQRANRSKPDRSTPTE